MWRQTDDPANRSRGQAFTLEAVTAGVVVLGGLLFALQVSGVTSLTASTAGGQALEQQEAVTESSLDTAAANESLRPTLLYWDDDSEEFHNVSEVDETFYTVGPPTAFGAILNESLDSRNLAYNVNLVYVDENGTVDERALVRNGMPSDDAVRATRTVTLYDDDRLLLANGTASNTTLSDTSAFYVPDRYPDGPIYNVVRVEVVAWRI